MNSTKSSTTIEKLRTTFDTNGRVGEFENLKMGYGRKMICHWILLFERPQGSLSIIVPSQHSPLDKTSVCASMTENFCLNPVPG